MTAPAESLRAASARLRALAGAASEAPWAATGTWWYPVMEIADDGRAIERSHGFHSVTDRLGSGVVAHAANRADATFIAAMSPPVALAVADWLDTLAAHHDQWAISRGLQDTARAALAVARAINEGARA